VPKSTKADSGVPSITRQEEEGMRPDELAGEIISFLETAIHTLLCLREVYPRGELRRGALMTVGDYNDDDDDDDDDDDGTTTCCNYKYW